MKNTYKYIFVLFLLANVASFAGNNKENNDPALAQQYLSAEALAQAGMQNQPVKFLENKGQMTDMDNNPVPFVLFKAEAPGMNMYITEKGITYTFIQSEENESEETENEKEGKMHSEKEENIIFKWERVDMELKGATIKKENTCGELSRTIIREGVSAEHFNYFYGHCPDGIYDVKQYEKITIKNIYPGIDWVLYNSNEKGFKYDFIVHPGADYKQIELRYKSKTPVKINAQGELELYTNYGNIKENAPVSFYEGQEIKTRFKQRYQKRIEKNEDNGYESSVVFDLEPGTRNPEHGTLIIDPQLVWATFYGGNADDGPMSIDTDGGGNVFVTGYTSSTNFPVQIAGTFFQGVYGGGVDAFILKFSNVGALLWATYYGGSVADVSHYIACDGIGNVFVTGYTQSTDFPVCNGLVCCGICTPGYFQGVHAGGGGDAFILKFDNSGNRLWATYYGGSGWDVGNSIACDANGNVFVTGSTYSTDFPVSVGCFQGANAGGGGADAFILKFSNVGNRLWATYYGGNSYEEGCSIAIDNSGNVFVTGYTGSTNFPVSVACFQGANAGGGDAFILKFSNAGNRLLATYYGGSGDDRGFSIACDSNGNVFVTGKTNSTNFPVQNAGTFFQGANAGGIDAFILKFDNSGNRLWATYYGGSGNELWFFFTYDNLAVNSCGNVYMSFNTNSSALLVQPSPSCSGGYSDNTYNGSSSGGVFGDIFLVLFSNTGALLWNTYIGGSGGDFREALAVDANDNLFMAGEWIDVTNSSTYPLTDPGGGAYYDATFNNSHDGYILKFIPDSVTYTQSQVNSTTCTPCNGSATVNVSCGNPNYSYVWSNGSSTMNVTSTTNTVTGLCPGTYTVTTTSNCNQTQTATFVITGTPCSTCTLAGQFTKGTANCTNCGCKEWIMVTATGGTSPYSYAWPDGYDKRYKNQLCSGVYTINIKDKNGCSINVNLTAP